MNKSILYFCYPTARYGHSSGIQKVVRSTAKHFLEQGYSLLPVKINNGQLELLSLEYLEGMSHYGGPKIDEWSLDYQKNISLEDVEFIIQPDLVYGDELKDIIDFSIKNNLKVYSIFYDAIPIILKDLYPTWWQKYHLDYMKKLSENGKVMAISHSAVEQYKMFINKKDLSIKYLPLPTRFIEGFGKKEKINNSKNINILYVSTVEIRKNHKTLIDAFEIANEILSKEGYSLHLDIVGNTDEEKWKVSADIVRDACARLPVDWHKNKDDEFILNLYQNADFTVYPSIYEGYGLPIVESLFHETPCIVANNSSLKEISSYGGCILFETYDVEELAGYIIELSTRPDLRKELVEETKNIPNYTWDDYVKNIVEFARS